MGDVDWVLDILHSTASGPFGLDCDRDLRCGSTFGT